MWRNSGRGYGSLAKFLHWIITLLLLINIVGGYFLGDMPKDAQPMIYNLHKLNGLSILILVLIRLGWTLVNTKPSLPFGTPQWQRFTEKAVHVLLYVALICMPLAGWIGSSAAGKAPYLGDIKFGLPVAQSKELAGTAFDVHNTLAIVLIVLISIHTLAALYHHFIKRDDILRRMLPFGRHH